MSQSTGRMAADDVMNDNPTTTSPGAESPQRPISTLPTVEADNNTGDGRLVVGGECGAQTNGGYCAASDTVSNGHSTATASENYVVEGPDINRQSNGKVKVGTAAVGSYETSCARFHPSRRRARRTCGMKDRRSVDKRWWCGRFPLYIIIVLAFVGSSAILHRVLHVALSSSSSVVSQTRNDERNSLTMTPLADDPSLTATGRSNDSATDGGVDCRRNSRASLRKLCSHHHGGRGRSDCLCLRRLRLAAGDSKHVDDANIDASSTRLSADARRLINAIPGSRLDRRGILAALPAVTDMQRSLAVTGSVGQLGDAGVGKLTGLLAQLVDVDVGERLLVVDPFNATGGHVSQFDRFAATADQFDLDVVTSTTGSADDDVDDTRRRRQRPPRSNSIYVHRGTSSDWNALDRCLAVWNMPQFRLIVVETTSSSSSPSSSSSSSTAAVDAMALRARLDLAVCLLRDGGLIALDVSDGLGFDVDGRRRGGSAGVAESLIDGFIERHGGDLIAPLVLIDDTLYLTTTGWRPTYAEHLRDWLRRHHVTAAGRGDELRDAEDDGHQLVLETARGFRSHVFFVVR